MNKFIGVGTLPRSAIQTGSDRQVLRFTLRTFLGYNKKTSKDRWAFVPCVIFKPAEATVNLLVGEQHGVLIGLEGRVNTSKFETQDGKTKYSTEVIVEERSLQLLELHASAPGPEAGSETGHE